MWRAGVLGCCSLRAGRPGTLGVRLFCLVCAAYSLLAIYLKIFTRRLEQSSAAELFALSARVDVACWRFGLLEF